MPAQGASLITTAMEGIFEENGFPAASAFIRLDVDRERFDNSVKRVLMRSCDWTPEREAWTRRVTYFCKRHPGDPDFHDVRVVSIGSDESQDVKCFRKRIAHGPLMADTGETLQREVCITARPPPLGVRYDTVHIESFRSFSRRSANAPGVIFRFKFSVEWRGRSFLECHSTDACPRFRISLESVAGSCPIDPKWMADNVTHKWRDVVYGGDVEHACLTGIREADLEEGEIME